MCIRDRHARETANLCAVMASELGLNPKKAKRAGLLHDIGKVPDEEPELGSGSQFRSFGADFHVGDVLQCDGESVYSFYDCFA